MMFRTIVLSKSKWIWGAETEVCFVSNIYYSILRRWLMFCNANVFLLWWKFGVHVIWTVVHIFVIECNSRRLPGGNKLVKKSMAFQFDFILFMCACSYLFMNQWMRAGQNIGQAPWAFDKMDMCAKKSVLSIPFCQNAFQLFSTFKHFLLEILQNYDTNTDSSPV
jgi:hypothetical protein